MDDLGPDDVILWLLPHKGEGFDGAAFATSKRENKYTKLSILESTQVVYQLSSALEYLHNRNPSIGHRDIKPENILVERRGADGIYVKIRRLRPL